VLRFDYAFATGSVVPAGYFDRGQVLFIPTSTGIPVPAALIDGSQYSDQGCGNPAGPYQHCSGWLAGVLDIGEPGVLRVLVEEVAPNMAAPKDAIPSILAVDNFRIDPTFDVASIEGQAFIVTAPYGTAPFQDPSKFLSPTAQMVSFNWSVGAPCQVASSNMDQATILCADNADNVPLSLLMTDNLGTQRTVAGTMDIANALPTASLTSPVSVSEGQSFNLNVISASDPSQIDVTSGFTYDFDCGDGAGFIGYTAASTVSCPTSDNGSRAVKARIKDKDGGVKEMTGTVPRW
jgi:hypothetical protein